MVTIGLTLFLVLLFAGSGYLHWREVKRALPRGYEEYPKWLREMVDANAETIPFAEGYSRRKQYKNQPIDIRKDVKKGEVPLFLQWDKRWGYDDYGGECIARAGCGPTCLSMAYVYLSGNTDMNPRAVADFAVEQGYRTEEGTSWDLWIQGAAALGLSGRQIALDEQRMKSSLDEGAVIICSMRPGDFTTTGHFILIRGYDGTGFFVNDPNSRANSKKIWEYETLEPQIKGIWALSKQ